MSRVIITGGAGFIGSRLCDFFLEHDHDVLVFIAVHAQGNFRWRPRDTPNFHTTHFADVGAVLHDIHNLIAHPLSELLINDTSPSSFLEVNERHVLAERSTVSSMIFG